jgi:hypothetical protein
MERIRTGAGCSVLGATCWCFVLVLLLVLSTARPVAAYSVLTHEANVDAVWDDAIKPLLVQRFPRTTPAALLAARAYAYGGSAIQDLGYYPFGSHFFSNLVHYVRSGDFVEALIRDAGDVNEYAFALGALAHYAADNAGHPIAINRSVPMMFPKLGAKYGPEVTYVDSPAEHVIVEFSFDVVQMAAGVYLPDAYHRFLGFEVAGPLLDRAFRETYGFDLGDVFVDTDLAIGTYRHAISEIIPQLAEVAWRDKHEEIAKISPQARRETFVFRLTRQEYEHDFGANYRKSGWFARFIRIVYKVVPKVGPLRPLTFKTPTAAAEALFLDSFKQTQRRYRTLLDALRGGRLNLANTDFDTGQRAQYGEYALADKTYAELISRLATRDFGGVSSSLRAEINRYYVGAEQAAQTVKARKRLAKVQAELADLNGRVTRAR